jgi:hypothetical protein
MLLARNFLCCTNKCVYLAIAFNYKHIFHKKAYFYFLCLCLLNNPLPIRVQSEFTPYP